MDQRKFVVFLMLLGIALPAVTAAKGSPHKAEIEDNEFAEFEDLDEEEDDDFIAVETEEEEEDEAEFEDVMAEDGEDNIEREDFIIDDEEDMLEVCLGDNAKSSDLRVFSKRLNKKKENDI